MSQFNKGVYSVIVAADETLLDEGQTPKVSLSLSSSVADPGSGAFLTPGIRDGLKIKIRIRDEYFGSYFRELRNKFLVKILKFFDADPDPGNFLARDPGS